MGYVGLPLMVAFAAAGLRRDCSDTDAARMRCIARRDRISKMSRKRVQGGAAERLQRHDDSRR